MTHGCSLLGSPRSAGPSSPAIGRQAALLLLPALTVHGGEHEGDVRGQEVVHLVAGGRGERGTSTTDSSGRLKSMNSKAASRTAIL